MNINVEKRDEGRPDEDFPPLIFTPTDAACSSIGSCREKDVERKILSQKKQSRMPLMHPNWYRRVSSAADLPVSTNNNDVTSTLPCQQISHHDLPHLSITFSRQKYYSRLVHPSDDRMRVPDHVLPSTFFSVFPSNSAGKQNSIVTIFAIWNTMMGTSLLTIPWGFVQSGFTLGVLLIIFMGALTFYTAFRVLRAKEYLDHEVFEFSDVCKHFLGSIGEWIGIIFCLLTFLGGMLVYWVLMTNFLYGVGVFAYDQTHSTGNSTTSNPSTVLCPTGYPIPNNNSHTTLEGFNTNSSTQDVPFHTVWWTSNRTVPIYLALIVFFLLNFKSPTVFTKFNCLGTLAVFFILAFVIAKAAKWGWNFQFEMTPGPDSYQLPQFRSTFPALTGVLSLAYFLHNAIITIMKNNERQENNTRDLSLGFLLVSLTYLIVGVVFYASFPLPKACIAANLLENLSTNDVFSTVARCFLLVQMMTVFPLLAYMFRINVLYPIFGNIYPGLPHVIFVNVAVLVACLLVAMFYPHIGDIIRYSGALCGFVAIFCLPCLVYIMAQRSLGELSRPSIVFHSLIIVFGALNFIAQFVITPSI